MSPDIKLGGGFEIRRVELDHDITPVGQLGIGVSLIVPISEKVVD
ncbi:hypothetical protein [Vibrio splendidus]|nr:hypothetical protein [Vibrio splendidus]